MGPNRLILYTRHDGGVNLCHPAPDCVSWLANGGWWGGKGLDLEEQVERAVADGHHEYAARRFVRALDKGGCTTAEAYEIIRDRDCGHLGTGFEVWDASELPDNWFRDAWRRSHNGGPISIDMEAARQIQFARIVSGIKRENDRRRRSLAGFDKPVRINHGTYADLIHKAQTPDDLRRIWPSELAP